MDDMKTLILQRQYTTGLQKILAKLLQFKYINIKYEELPIFASPNRSGSFDFR
jgi:hypothetical protein